MKNFIKSIPILAIILLVSCNQNKKSDYSKQVEIKAPSVAYSASNHPGKKLMETKCYVCHSPTAPEKDGRIGPPMIAIKAHYINEQTTKEEFTQALWNFVEKPTAEKAKLRGAVKRFGVMPYQPFKKDEIAQIAEYLFEYEIEEPEWFKEHWENGHKMKRKPYINSGEKDGSSASVKANTPAERRLQYALNTKKLGKKPNGYYSEKRH